MKKVLGEKTSKYEKIDLFRIWFSDEKLFRTREGRGGLPRQ